MLLPTPSGPPPSTTTTSDNKRSQEATSREATAFQRNRAKTLPLQPNTRKGVDNARWPREQAPPRTRHYSLSATHTSEHGVPTCTECYTFPTFPAIATLCLVLSRKPDNGLSSHLVREIPDPRPSSLPQGLGRAAFRENARAFRRRFRSGRAFTTTITSRAAISVAPGGIAYNCSRHGSGRFVQHPRCLRGFRR